MQTDPPDLDTKFEQWLLDSARRDVPPAELTERAWARFAKTSGQIAAGATGGAVLSRLGLRAARFQWAWLGAGMLAGSALTLAVLTLRGAPAVPSVPSAPTAQERREEAALHARADDEPTERAPRATPRALPTAPPPAAPVALQPQRVSAASSPRAPSSTLAAEVRALDAVRREIESGQPERALVAVRDFHREFPRAQLAADAEGLAIEALLARGDRGGAAQRARQFLQHYPEDPHAARFEPIAGER